LNNKITRCARGVKKAFSGEYCAKAGGTGDSKSFSLMKNLTKPLQLLAIDGEFERVLN
jgi:hypothetical protein